MTGVVFVCSTCEYRRGLYLGMTVTSQTRVYELFETQSLTEAIQHADVTSDDPHDVQIRVKD